MMNLRNVVMGLGVLAMFGTGCVVEVVRGPYEACKAGEACSNGTVCTSASYTSSGAPANFCSTNCTRGEQCPVSPYGSGYAPTCVVSVSAGTGLCYDSCTANIDCAVNTQCALVPGTGVGSVPAVRICVPTSTVSAACGATGQSCCAGNLCSSGLVCNAGVCAAPVACGGSGQACCAGNACNTGLACNAGVCTTAATPNRTPYQKCATATDVCGGGTSCVTSIAQAAGKTVGTFCTTACPGGLPSVCPGYVAGAATQTVTCLSLGTPSAAQCFRLCSTQNDCASDNTTCTAFTTSGGGSVRVCVPVGPRV